MERFLFCFFRNSYNTNLRLAVRALRLSTKGDKGSTCCNEKEHPRSHDQNLGTTRKGTPLPKLLSQLKLQSAPLGTETTQQPRQVPGTISTLQDIPFPSVVCLTQSHGETGGRWEGPTARKRPWGASKGADHQRRKGQARSLVHLPQCQQLVVSPQLEPVTLSGGAQLLSVNCSACIELIMCVV